MDTMIIGASRRTDIPSYYSKWFFRRLEAGFACTRNPMNPHQVSRISLSPDVVDGFVFRTKNPVPMLDGGMLTIVRFDAYPFFAVSHITSFQIRPKITNQKINEVLSMGLINRSAREDDIESIAEIKVWGWQTAYRGIVDEDYLDAMSAQELSARLKAYPLASFLLSEKNGDVVGFCRISESSLAGGATEIREIYIRPDMKRQGIGTKLFEYTVKELNRRGYKTMRLGVFKENAGARRFYEKMGGRIMGKGVINLFGKPYPSVEYVFEI